MKIKHGVSLKGISPEIIVAILIIEPILNEYGQELVITSGREGQHVKNSAHYRGDAIDFRNWQLVADGNLHAAITVMQDALGDEYWIKDSDTHIHLETKSFPTQRL